MKKYLIVFLMLVMVFSFTVSGLAFDKEVPVVTTTYYDVTNNYMDKVISEADIYNKGNALGYSLGLSDDLTNHQFKGRYYFNNETYFAFYSYANENIKPGEKITAMFGHEFYNRDNWIASFDLGKSYDNNFYGFINTSKKLKEKVTLHNNLRLAFLDDYTGKAFSSGFTYDLDNDNKLKVSFIRDGYAKELENIADDMILRTALKIRLTEDYSNIVFIENKFGIDNLSITEQVIYNPVRDFYLEGAFTLNTEYTNEFSIESEKKIRDNLYFTADYKLLLDLDDEYNANLGLVYKF